MDFVNFAIGFVGFFGIMFTWNAVLYLIDRARDKRIVELKAEVSRLRVQL